jgi:hypothetical protein
MGAPDRLPGNLPRQLARPGRLLDYLRQLSWDAENDDRALARADAG